MGLGKTLFGIALLGMALDVYEGVHNTVEYLRNPEREYLDIPATMDGIAAASSLVGKALDDQIETVVRDFYRSHEPIINPIVAAGALLGACATTRKRT